MNKVALKEFILSFYQAWKEQDEVEAEKFYDAKVKAYVDFNPVSLQDMLERLRFSKRTFKKAEYGIEDFFIDADEGKIAVRMKQRVLPASLRG